MAKTLLLAFSLLSPQTGTVEQGTLTIALACTAVPTPTGSFRLTIANIAVDDTAVLLGTVLANGRWYELRDLTLIVKGPDQDAPAEYQYRSAGYPTGVAGRIDHWILPLPGGSAFSMTVSPRDFFSPLTSNRLANLPSAATVIVRLVGRPVTYDLNVDMTGLRNVRLWTGTATSLPLRVRDDCTD
jgi:hypothetical protein